MFTHLHLHTEYSFLDSIIQVKKLVPRIRELGMTSCAITDHGSLFGALRFYRECRKHDIKPIIGSEMYITPDVNVKNRDIWHLILLAKDFEGYQNLMKLSSNAQLYYKPRIDYKMLREHSRGLVCMSACLAGEIPRALLRHNDEDMALQALYRYKDIFGDDFYLEIQDNGFEGQKELNKTLLRLGKETDTLVIPTNDCHYLMPEDRDLHQTVRRLNRDNDQYVNGQEWVRSPQEMWELFPRELCDKTQLVVDKCNLEIPLGKHVYPTYQPVIKSTPKEEIRELALQGLKNRELDQKLEYRERLEYELTQIINNKFDTYLLVVADFIREARSRNIAVGPGRGSAAGSLVCYCLGITDLDPLPWNLLFERFINPERVSLPDIDVDFCERRRPEILQYMAEKYGDAAQIANINCMQGRMAIKDMARVLQSEDGSPIFSIREAESFSNLVPSGPDSPSIAELYQQGVFDKLIDGREQAKRLIDYSMRVEGMARNAGVHAAGLVVADTQICNYVPVYTDKNGKRVTQYDKKDVEDAGLVKIDFLGLKNMTLIQLAIDNIKKTTGETVDIRNIPLDDPKVWELYCAGDMEGVFQMESDGMRKYLARLQPEKFEDIIALLALFRPGPLESGMVDEYMDRKKGNKDVSYFGLDDLLKPILEPTYGVIVYQEQVMQVARAVAGYSLGKADLLRKAMGKKDARIMAENKSEFVEGAIRNGISEKKAEQLFGLIEKFARYGFNKSHSAAYALISYQTAWLKTHYPMEFMAALMDVEKNNVEKLGKYMRECRKSFPVAPPDVLKSDIEFGIRDKQIRFGLSGIKNVPANALAELQRLRKTWEEPVSIVDLLSRSSTFNLKFLEFMNKAGAFDCFEPNRAITHANRETLVREAQALRKKKDLQEKKFANQMTLLKIKPKRSASNGLGLSEEKILFAAPWPLERQLAYEKEVMGFYVSGMHPVEAHIAGRNRTALMDGKNNEKSDVLVIIEEVQVKTSGKTGKKFLTGKISDESREMRFVCWDYSRLCDDAGQFVVQPDTCYVMSGRFSEDRFSWNGEGEIPLQFVAEGIKPVWDDNKILSVSVQASALSDEALDDIQSLCNKHKVTRAEAGKAAAVLVMQAVDAKRIPQWMEHFTCVVNKKDFAADIAAWRQKHERPQ